MYRDIYTGMHSVLPKQRAIKKVPLYIRAYTLLTHAH